MGKSYIFMIRCKIPGGKLTAEQYLKLDELAGQYANGTLRITTRQGIQFHGVVKDNLRETIAGINACLLSTLGACGDVNRNVMVDPTPLADRGIHEQLQTIGANLAARFAPQSGAYHEIWLNGEKVNSEPESEEVEPIYGKVYLPRKFKIGITLPENNITDIHSHDLGLLAVVEQNEIVGFNILVGGGMGRTQGKIETFPHLAQPICYVPVEHVEDAAECVVKIFRDHGNRENRKRARIKYVVHDWGVEKFRETMGEYMRMSLEEPKPVSVKGFNLLLGWHSQKNGKYWYGISVENGRIKDEGKYQLRTALGKIIDKFRPEVRLTAQQDILLCNLESNARSEIEKTLRKHGVPLPNQLSRVQQYSMACPAIPTCGLAISESERVMPQLTEQMAQELKKMGLEKEPISVRMTGCPNGCARPYQSDIGVVGRSGEKYALFLGGSVLGNRLNFFFQDLVLFKEIVPILKPLFQHFKEHRDNEESFGDYCQRMGAEQLHSLIPEELRKPLPKSHMPEDIPHEIPLVNLSTEKMDEKASEELVPVGAGEKNGAPVASKVDSKPIPSEDTGASFKEMEWYFTGEVGEEICDYRLYFNGDGSVRETVVCFYGEGVRAQNAHIGDPLCQESHFVGQVDLSDLSSARKHCDIHYVGAAGHEHKDFSYHYHLDGRVARTFVFFYEGNHRAREIPSLAPIRRQEVYSGKWEG